LIEINRPQVEMSYAGLIGHGDDAPPASTSDISASSTPGERAMRTILPSLAVAFVLAASGASAATYEAYLPGMLVAAGNDPNLQVGFPVTMTARFDQSMITGFNPVTLSGVADVWGLPLSGYDYYQLTVGPLVYSSRADILDGELGPLIAFSGGKITRFTTESDGYTFAPRPLVTTGLWYQDPNTIQVGWSIYSGYRTDGAIGAWDFADSFVRAVPEPATWGLMLAGFFGLGAALRSRRRQSRTVLGSVHA
jgi:hypothetical protein